MEDRSGLLAVDVEEVLESLLREDRSETGVIVPLDIVEGLSTC
jgi:hypothetical protein